MMPILMAGSNIMLLPVSTVKQEVADDTNMLLLDLDESRCMGVIDNGDSQYGIGSYVTSCFDCETGSG